MKIAKVAKMATETVNNYLKESGLNTIRLNYEDVPTFDVDGVTPCIDFDFWLTEGKKAKQLATLGFCSAALLPEFGFKLKTVKDSSKKLFYLVITSTSTMNVVENDPTKRCNQNWPVVAQLVQFILSELPDCALILGAASEGGWKEDYNAISLTGVVSNMPNATMLDVLSPLSADAMLQVEIAKFSDAAKVALSGSHPMTVLWTIAARAAQFKLKAVSEESVLQLVDVTNLCENAGFPFILETTKYFESEASYIENVYLTALATLPQNEFVEAVKQLTLFGMEEWSAHSTKFATGYGFRVKRDQTSEENLERFVAHLSKLITPEIAEPEKTTAKEVAKKAKAKKAAKEEVVESDIVVLEIEEVVEEEVKKPKKAPKVPKKK